MSLKFSKDNLFPLIDETSSDGMHGRVTYQEAQAHSVLVDQELGLQTGLVEKSLLKSQFERPDQEVQAWIGLPVQTLLTPYTELREMLARVKMKDGETITDLGAGYGRMGFIIGRLYPEVQFRGYELVAERVEEGLRALGKFGYRNVELQTQDLTSPEFQLPRSEVYFIYDFGSRSAIEKTLQNLKVIARLGPIRVIGRGRASRDAIEQDHPWLAQVQPPEHFAHYSIYRS